MRHMIAENIDVLGKFDTEDTVTISLYKISDESAVSLNSNSCNEIGSIGVFKWNTSEITDAPTAFIEYLWIMDNSTYKQYGKIVLGGYPDLIKAQTDLVTAARMGALTDWINGGRLDLILDIIAGYVVELELRLTAVRAARLDANISSRSSHTAANVKTAIEVAGSLLALINAKTASLPSGIAKNVALPSLDIFMVLSSDHVTAATGKTVTGQIRKDGGAFANITNAITEVGSGWYTIADGLTQAEMNADKIVLKFIGPDCDQKGIEIFPT